MRIFYILVLIGYLLEVLKVDDFEKTKLALLEREVAVKEGELEHKKMEGKSSAWRSPLVVAIFVAATGAFSNAGVTYYDALQARNLALSDAENGRILEMIKAGEPAQVKANLVFLIDTGLISDAELTANIRKYYEGRDPATGPGTSVPMQIDPDFVRRFREYFESQELKYLSAEEFLVLGSSNFDPGSSAFGRNTPPPVELWPNIAKVASVLDEFRERHGAPIQLVSLYRNPEYSDAIGGAPRSQHLLGQAADFRSAKGSPDEWAAILREMRDEGLFQGGIGINSSFVHVDIRGANSDWGGR